jgi:dolichol kinase
MSRRRTKNNEPAAVSSRSTASIFQDGQIEPAGNEEVNKPDNGTTSNAPSNKPFGDDDDIESSPLIMKVLYRAQDFLNENMTLLKFVQVCAFTYLLEIIYFNYDKFDKLDINYPMIGFNVFGVFSGVILSFIKRDENPDMLPEFEQLYSILFPLLYNLIWYSKNHFLPNLCLNYFIADSLHPAFSTVSAVMFFNVYAEDEAITSMGIIQMSLMHAILLYGFKYMGDGKSFKKAESQMLTLILITLIFNNELVYQYLPITIFQKLIITTVVMFAAILPIFEYVPHIVSIGLYAAGFYFLTVYQLNPVFNENAVVWLRSYILGNEEYRNILGYWLGGLAVVIPVVFLTVNKLGVNFRRKVWHFVVVVMFLFRKDILTTNIEFTLICLLGAIILFIGAEVIRANKLTVIGEYLYKVLLQFQDSKDMHGPLNLSYIYLLVGVTLPIAYDYMTNEKATIIRFMGLIGIGLGDSMASIVGRKFGSLKWKGSNKSVQGTIAFVVATFASIVAVDHYMSTGLYTPITNWENVFVTALLTGVLEGVSDLNDNLLVPIVMPVILEILNICYA